MKSAIRKRTYKAIYRLLNRVSPLDSDCGMLCGAACCKKGEDDIMGIYLLPGEDKVHERRDSWMSWSSDDAENYDFPNSWKGKVYFVRCEGPEKCKREIRPMQCRTFPLTPHLDEDDNLILIYNDMELPYRCPLIDEELPLNDDFVQATYTVWSHLLRDPLIYDLVKMDSEIRMSDLATLEKMLNE